MKKSIFLMVSLAVLLILSGCQKEGELKTGKYVSDDKLSTVNLLSDDEFIFIQNNETSNAPVGSYIVEDGKLTLSVKEDEYYTFTIEENKIVFESCVPEGAAIVKSGTVFTFSS